MQFETVVLESIVGAMPEGVLSSEWIESELAEAYERLKLPQGRLELMTGIKERRCWEDSIQPSQASASAGTKAMQALNLAPADIDLLIHSSVCRDRLEPATAAYVHGLLGLGYNTQTMDVSNACLGFMNAITLAASMIEAGQIKRALIVSGENGKPLLEHTLRKFKDPAQTRKTIKPLFANLTIGSGAVAATITAESIAKQKLARFGASAVGTDSSANELCQGGTADQAGELEMQTNSEELMVAGVRLAKRVWADLKELSGWNNDTPNRVLCHQVGSQHQRLLYSELGLPLEKDYSTYPRYGNTGSVALPITLAEAIEDRSVRSGDKAVLLGIGSGLSCMMMTLEIL